MKNLSIAYKAINDLVMDVTTFVKQNGGFITTTNETCDKMYAYIVDLSGESGVFEEKIVAIMVENDILYIATCPLSLNLIINNKNEINEDEWLLVGTCSDCVLTPQTILSIADSVKQYV